MRRRGKGKAFYLISVGLGLLLIFRVLLQSRVLVLSEKVIKKEKGSLYFLILSYCLQYES